MPYLSQEIFHCSNLTVRLYAKSDRPFVWSSKSDRQSGGVSYKMFLVFDYVVFADKTKSTEASVYFSFPHMRRLKATLQHMADQLADAGSGIFDETEDEEHGYHCDVSLKFREKKMRVKGATSNAMLYYDTYLDVQKNELHKGVRLEVGGPDHIVFLPENQFDTLEYIISEVNLLLNCQQMVAAKLAAASRGGSSASSKNVKEEET